MDFIFMRFVLAIFLIAFHFSPAIAARGSARPPPGWTRPDSSASAATRYATMTASEARNAARRDANSRIVFDVFGKVDTSAGTANLPSILTTAADLASFLAKRTFWPVMLGKAALDALKDWSGAELSPDGSTWLKPAHGTGPTSPTEYQYGSSGWYADFSSLGEWYVHYAYPDSANISYYFDGAALDVLGRIVIDFHFTQNGNSYPGHLTLAPATRNKSCPAGQYMVNNECVSAAGAPYTAQEWLDLNKDRSVPTDLPAKMPFGVPVEDPIMNPTPYPSGVVSPLYVPLGDPVPNNNPDGSPNAVNPWKQPALEVWPDPRPISATDPAGEPWGIKTRPVEIPQPSPSPNPNPAPAPDPSNPTLSPNNPSNPNAPTNKDAGLCDLFPDILACAKLGDPPAAEDVTNKDVNTSVTPLDGFGANTGTCPADKIVNTRRAGAVPISWQLPCQYALGIRPVVLAMAWLAAAFILIGAFRRD